MSWRAVSADGAFELQAGIVDEARERDRLHFVAEAGEAAEPVEQRAAPEPFVGVARQFVLVGAQLQARVGAVLVEIFLDDAVLQHAAERQRKAARRPGQPPGDRIVGGKHQHGAERQRDDAVAEPARRHALAGDEREQRAADEQAGQQREGRAVRRRRDRDQHDEPDALAAPQPLAAQQQQIQRQHAEPAENVGEQDGGEPGQGGDYGERRDHRRPAAAAVCRARACAASARRPTP